MVAPPALPGIHPSKHPRALSFSTLRRLACSGGTGTYAFLVGLGAIEADRVIVRQYVMRDYDEELALLDAVSRQLAQHDAIVTYNGKTFDVPLMETRFIASRRSDHAIPSVHLDLLFSARRLLRGQLDRCALGDVERSVLGFHRIEDLPSWMIPSVYFQFVREADPRLLGGVLEHNRDDILSLVALTGWLARTYQSAPCMQSKARPSGPVPTRDCSLASLGHMPRSAGTSGPCSFWHRWFSWRSPVIGAQRRHLTSRACAVARALVRMPRRCGTLPRTTRRLESTRW